ncbi:hypothetical protein [Paraburkholderia adhaesiva]|uniref:hypothetical protein n=1 Tax=Paraburkholderia adhaesiva TaxID=2883244 RepID=UPI001F20608C|nr:hypothetical protein [Paraburkholderia adhaesiva]
MNDKEYQVHRGDLMLYMATVPMLVDEEGSLLACYWSLARVTSVTPNGHVGAYRTFGTHFVSREEPDECAFLSASKVDVQAIERDMNARVVRQRDANRFKLPDYAYEYVQTFMLETTKP